MFLFEPISHAKVSPYFKALFSDFGSASKPFLDTFVPFAHTHSLNSPYHPKAHRILTATPLLGL